MNQLIGLAGFARSGKTTVANHLYHKHGFNHESFAAPIRSFVADLLDITLAELEDCKESKIEGFEKTPREMMQTLGTEWGRQMIQDNLWLKALEGRLSNAAASSKVVLSDIRFENEADMIRSLGGAIWHINRREQTTINASKHTSEVGIEIKPADMVIFNSGSIASLDRSIDCILDDII